MQTHPIHVTDGRELVLEVRSALFVFSEVLDVFVTGRSDVLVVVCAARPRPAQWLAELRAAGYQIPVRRRPRDATPDVVTTIGRSSVAA
jgi:hypothetical protein